MTPTEPKHQNELAREKGADTELARARLLAHVADWAQANASSIGRGDTAIVHAPASCSLATGFGLLAEGAQLLADLSQTRATPLSLIEADYWFDVRNFKLADTTGTSR